MGFISCIEDIEERQARNERQDKQKCQVQPLNSETRGHQEVNRLDLKSKLPLIPDLTRKEIVYEPPVPIDESTESFNDKNDIDRINFAEERIPRYIELTEVAQMSEPSSATQNYFPLETPKTPMHIQLAEQAQSTEHPEADKSTLLSAISQGLEHHAERPILRDDGALKVPKSLQEKIRQTFSSLFK